MALDFKATTSPQLLGLTLDLRGDNGGLLIKVTDLKPFTIKLEAADGGFREIAEKLVLAAIGWVSNSVPGLARSLIVGKSKQVADSLGYDFQADGEKITLVASDLKFGTQDDFLLVTGNVDVK
jgi:hypothetical protein